MVSVDAFHELCQSSPREPARALVSRFEGCSGGKAGEVAADFLDRAAGTLTKDEIEDLLTQARGHSRQVDPKRLGLVGELKSWPAYAKAVGNVELPCSGSISATIPYVVEVWAKPLTAPDKDAAQIFVNRDPMVNETPCLEKGNTLTVYGGEWWFGVKVGSDPCFILDKPPNSTCSASQQQQSARPETLRCHHHRGYGESRAEGEAGACAPWRATETVR